jgi:radical SAM protein with 4Fe4S-binding SPASM domain
MTRPLGFMEMSLFRKIVEEIATFGEPVRSREIELFHFGESMLHPQLEEMASCASGLRLRVSLSVNAPQLSPERAERILSSGAARLIVSLDGHDAESYRRIRGKAADFGKAVSNLRALGEIAGARGTATSVCIRAIRFHGDESSHDRIREIAEDCGLPLESRPFFPWANPELAGLGEVEKYPPGMPCPFPWQYLAVQWDGTVVPCCRDYDAVNPMGSVVGQTLREIWNGDRYERFRDEHRCGSHGENRFCRDCMEMYYTEPPEREAAAR